MTTSATIAVINGKKQVLLQLRSAVPIWVIPGGRIEKGETRPGQR